MSNELVPRDLTPAEMVQNAIDKGIDAEGISTLASVYERMEARRAEREFAVAMLAFQDECPRVLKTRKVEFRTKRGAEFKAQYAALDDVTQQVNGIVRKHGFMYRWNTRVENKQVTVACEVTHVGGHTKTTEFSAPVDPEPALSAAHSVASAVTFCQRYTFCLAFGIVAGLPDDDGKAAFTEQGTITAAQAETLRTLVDSTGSDNEKFWKFVGVSSYAEIPARDYTRIEQALRQRKRRAS